MTTARRRLALLAAPLALALAIGCGDPEPAGTAGQSDLSAVFSDAGGGDAGLTDGEPADPGIADPGAADPGTADAGLTDPGLADPGAADPGTADPGATDAGLADPGATDAGLADPGAADPGAGDPGPADPGTTDPGVSDPGGPDLGDDAGPTCPVTPGADDKLRYAVVAFPYAADYQQANAYQVWSLASDGALAATAQTFAMGRAPWGRVAFTPDGAIGAVAQDDGTVGLFRLDAAGAPTVLDAAFDGAAFLGADAFYADVVYAAPSGRALWVLDPNWANNGGGLFRVDLACDGHPVAATRLAFAKLARAMALLPGGDRAVLAADEVDAHAGAHAHLLSLTDGLSWQGSSLAFSDDEAIVSAAAATSDGAYVLIGDNSAFSGVPNRVAVVAVGPSGLAPVQELSGISDPAAIETSPWDNAALVLSAADGDALYRLTYDPGNAAAPFANAGELTYVGAGPALPSSSDQIRRGALTGRVVIAENIALRMVQFHPDGSVIDLGPTPTGGAGGAAIPGALGVQP